METRLAEPDQQTADAAKLSRADVAVVIPAWNEEASIGRVIDALPDEWHRRVVVADNNSTDYTADVARKFGATVVPARRQGYGSACLAALADIAKDPPQAVAFIDADFSDHPEQLGDVVGPVVRGEADLVMASRMMIKQPKGALLPQAIFGNWLACRLIKLFFGVRYTDLGPFRCVSWAALQNAWTCRTRPSGGLSRCKSRLPGWACGRWRSRPAIARGSA